MASVSIPETHAAWTYTRRGDPAQILNLTWNFPTPDPASLKPGEALIKVSAVALNSGTLSLMRKIPHFTNNPWVPEIDFAGTIVALAPDDGTNKGNEGEGEGEGDADFQVGDQIVGLRTIPFLLKYNGVLQEYLVSPVSVLAKKPESLSMVEASGLPAVGCTAVQAVNVAGVKKGNKVLVTAASGGLGSMLVQVAKAVVGPDGVVVGSCSGKNQELVRSLGADEVSLATTFLDLAPSLLFQVNLFFQAVAVICRCRFLLHYYSTLFGEATHPNMIIRGRHIISSIQAKTP